MDKYEQLFIRACKSQNAKQRIKSTYKRFYLQDEINDYHIATILMEICEKFNLIHLSKFVEEIDFLQKFSKKDLSYWEKVVQTAISTIRCARVSKLDGFITPRKFRD